MDEITSDNTPWGDLPTLALISIFRFLDFEDRFNVSLVCRKWHNAFESPQLWQSMELIFAGNLVNDTRRALQFLRKHASSLRYLKLRFLRCNSPRVREVLANMQSIFEELANNGRLESFELERFCFPEYRDQSIHFLLLSMMDTFKIFIRSQRQLLKVKFLKTYFKEGDGMDIINCVIDHNKMLRFLGIWNFFQQEVVVHTNMIFQENLSTLRELETLEINYCYISDWVLEKFRSHFKTLNVRYELELNLPHVILPESWRKFKRSCPEAVLNFEMVEIPTLDQFKLVLPRCLCVKELKYTSGFRLNSDRGLRMHGVSILQYLGDAFQNSLSKLSLEFSFVNVSMLSDAILRLIMTCYKLKSFTLGGVFQPSLARSICEFVLGHDTAFESLYLTFYFSNFESVEEMSRMQEYQHQLKERNIDFYFNLMTYQIVE